MSSRAGHGVGSAAPAGGRSGGEPFLDLAPGGPATLLGYANGYAGYLPTRAAFDAAAERPEQPEYEVLISRVAPGEPERALSLLGSSA